GNSNPTATSTNLPADQLETLTVETPIPTVSSPVLTACFTDSQEPSSDTRLISKKVTNQVETPSLDNILTLTNRFEDILGVTTNSVDSDGVEADVSNMEITIIASPTPTLRIHKDHPKSQMIGPVDTLIQTRNKSKEEELLQFKIQKVWSLVDCPKGVRPIGTKWVLKNKKDERGIVIRNKARLVAQGHTQEEGIDYDEVFAHVARIEAIRLFLAYASFMGFTVNQMDVKSAFLYGTIDEEVPDIMFAVSACARHQVAPKECHLHAVKRIFRYLKGHPKLRLWYPKESPFDLVTYSDSDYGGATQDHKSTTGGCHFLGRSNKIMPRLQFCDYHNMVAILEKSEHNVDFHPIVDFVEASPLMYALTFKPTVYVSHIQQFWSTSRIETMEERTKILATVDGILRTVTESSLRRNLKLKDEEGISSLPDAKLFENLTLMGYNISPNQKFTFQKGQFSHQWKYLIHTIMQCLSPKSTGFNKFSSNIATALGEGSGTPTEPHHTPSPKVQQTSPTTHSSPTLPPVTTFPFLTVTPSDTPHLRQYTRRARIAQSLALPPIVDEPASPLRDVSQGEACPTVSSLDAEQDRAYIAKTSTLPHESTSRVPSLAADEGSMQHKLDELTALCTSLQRQQSEMVSRFEAQELEINSLKARIKLLEDKDRGVAEHSGDDAPIKGRKLDVGEEAAERVSDDTKEMATVLTSMDAATVLASRVVEVPTGSGSIPTVGPPAAEVPTGTDVVPTAGLIFATTTVMDIQMARQLEEEVEREAQRMNEQIARDAEVARIHAEEELHMMINSLDRSNETTQQRKPWSKKQKRDYYMAVIKSNLGWKVKDFKGMTFKEIEAKFTTVWKQIENFIPMGSKEEAERFKRKGIREDLNQLWALVKESLNIRPASSDKEMELWVELKSLVHHVTSKDNEIFMLIEKDYPLRKGLAIVMICYKLQVENYSLMAIMEFPLLGEVPTASEKSSHCQKKRDATAQKIALLLKSSSNCQSKSYDSYAKLVPHVTLCILGITSNSKVRQLRAKAVVAKVSTSSSTPAISSEVSELKDMVRALLLDKKNQSSAPASSSTPASVKAIEPNCVTCGGAHSYQNCPATSGNVYRDNIQEFVSQAAAKNYNQGNTSFRPHMVANQIRPPGFPPHPNHQNNFNQGNNFNQNRGGNFNQSNFNQGGNFNQGQLHRPQVNQPSAYPAPAYQAPILHTQSVTQTDFESYIKANDAVLRNMQSQGQGVQNQCQGLQTQIANLTDMLYKFVSSNTSSSSGSGTLPSNTITNPKEYLKGITTRSGAAYQGPIIPTQSKVVKQGIKVTKDQVQTPSSQSTVPVQPSVIRSETQTLVSEPVVAPVSVLMPNLKPSILYPARRDNERHRDQANEQIKKFYKIFKEMSFEISFTDALILMPKFASTLKALIGNKEKLSEVARTSMNEHYSAVILYKLPRKLGDPGKFLIPCEFPGMDECLALANLDFEPDPRVPLILGRCFLKTGRALIDVHKGELTLRIGNEAITYNLDQTVRYSANYNQMTANKIDVICEMYSQKVIGFSDVTASGSPTPYDDPIVLTTSPILTLFGDSDFLLFEEADAFLEDYKPALQHQRRVNPKIHDVIKKEVEKLLDAGLIYPISDSPWVSPGTNTIVSLMVSPGIFQIPIDPRDQEKTTFTCPYGMFAYRRMSFGLCNAPGTFQRCVLSIFYDMVEKTMEVFMDDFSIFGNSFENCLSHLDKMLQRCEDTNLSLNWEKSHFMVKQGIVLGHCIKAFQTLKKRLTEAPILIAPNWDLPFELMCDASDFAIALKENLTPSSKSLTKSSSTSPKSFLEETNTFHNSLPEFENFYFDLEEISSGSTTTHSDISLSEYDSFIFDFANEEFPDELAHIIPPPEYDCFYFWDMPDPGELMSVLNSKIRENLSTTRVNLPIEDDHTPLLAYVVWIFVVYLTYPLFLLIFTHSRMKILSLT
nr:retrovirus-related Pol polyprotein from transposon 17.6 [Tanacetum cinerariifolium]